MPDRTRTGGPTGGLSMQASFRLRLGLYLTLAVAALCLVAAEQPFFPWAWACAAPALALMLAALLLEGRWALPIWAANVLGLGIAVAWGVWIDLRIFGDSDLGMPGVPLPAALLPDVGPLLAVLIVARLFRPKEAQDYWLLHGLGLLEVTLACVLASGPLFGCLLGVYVATGLWSLALFSLSGAPGVPAAAAARVRTGALGWLPAVLGAALALFLVLPRTAGQPWDPIGLAGPQATRMAETGAPQEMDLNRTGRLEVNEEVAFRVTARDAARRPKQDLGPNQYWRCRFVDRYERGKWTATYESSLAYQSGPPPVFPAGIAAGRTPFPPTLEHGLFDLGPRQFFLSFKVDPRKAGGFVLADPVVFRRPDGKVSGSCWKATDGNPLTNFLFLEAEGTLVSSAFSGRDVGRYEQVTLPASEEGLSLPLPETALSRGYREYLCAQPVPGLTDWTRALVKRMASLPGPPLEAEDAIPRPGHPDGVLPAAKWEGVARALCAHLARSGEYTYALERRRKDAALDPTLDFLCNVKEGYCEHYAGGLALMLRALGIPARVVIGYRGVEDEGAGSYLVRQSQAHAWVECLVPCRAPSGEARWQWLELDPTPAGEAPGPATFDLKAWRDRLVAAGEEFWQHFVLDYNPDQQESLWSAAAQALAGLRGTRLSSGWVPAAAGAALASLLSAAWLLRRFRRRRRHAPALGGSPAFYRRLLAILARRRRLRPRPSQTPREFAGAVCALLAATPPTAALAGVPGQVAELLYRARFGGRPLTSEEERAVGRDLDRLDAALASR